jgi:predicted site-specific integrase-resolvase
MNKKEDLESEEEMTSNMLEIMNVFVAKRNGLRKYKKKKIIKDE